MEVLGFSIEDLHRLMVVRSVLLKMLQSPDADHEVIAWVKRGGSAEVIRLDDFRTDQGRRPATAKPDTLESIRLCGGRYLSLARPRRRVAELRYACLAVDRA